MKNKKTLIFWIPRILTILFALFLSIFAMDAFQPGQDWLQNLQDLFMHLHPVFILAAVLLIAWRYELAGALLFFLLGMIYIVWAWGRFPFSVYLVITGPLFLISILFGVAWYMKK